jgi:hypothetical protein
MASIGERLVLGCLPVSEVSLEGPSLAALSSSECA